MSNVLYKPCTVEERDLFIMEYGGHLTRQIYETDEAIWALEPNEIVQDGEIIINPDYDNILLQRTKDDKYKENESKRAAKLLEGVIYSNVLFDSDTDQKINLTAKVLTLDEEDTIVWYGMNNDSLLCAKQDLVNIGALIETLHSFVWENNAYIKGLIDDAETVEEVENINISYERS